MSKGIIRQFWEGVKLCVLGSYVVLCVPYMSMQGYIGILSGFLALVGGGFINIFFENFVIPVMAGEKK